jgi:hypothetical protein
MKTFRITYLLGQLDPSHCPPPVVSALWPAFDGWTVSLSQDEVLVTVPDSAPPPADLGPLVRVEEVQPS